MHHACRSFAVGSRTERISTEPVSGRKKYMPALPRTTKAIYAFRRQHTNKNLVSARSRQAPRSQHLGSSLASSSLRREQKQSHLTHLLVWGKHGERKGSRSSLGFEAVLFHFHNKVKGFQQIQVSLTLHCICIALHCSWSEAVAKALICLVA